MTESLKRGLLSVLRVKGRLPTYINRRIIVIYCHCNKELLLASPLSLPRACIRLECTPRPLIVTSRPGSCPLGEGGFSRKALSNKVR